LKLGTSTPKADPSGDYAFRLFERIEESGLGPAGSAAALKARALQLTGGPSSPSPPPGRNVYGALVAGEQADLFVTYCTNATTAIREQPALQLVPVPAQIDVVADYGVVALPGASSAALALLDLLLGADGQAVLRRHGFAPGE
jgi:molybdate transport system substrate-binding protein